ncbi:hypothetical protein [Methylomicrobium album]|uniref:hypothetical protein n=1 Tax=Methylomicrobium album TaxID=39775 RepID=UPI0002623E6C|nr:hypothetical protein [Methylomicrobium album]
MNQTDHVVKYLKDNLENLNLEWINTGRVSEDWKSQIFGHTLYKRQIGVYKRKNMILVRLENSYNTHIDGVTKYSKIPAGDSWEASFSRFRGGKGVCVKVDSLESFKKLLNWYFSATQN